MYISFSMAERRTLASRQLQNPPRSVFESKHDNTHSDETDPNQQRWKYKGPWLASKTEGAFEKYIKKDVKRRKMDFKRFLRKHLAEMKAVSRRREATESGEDPEESDVDRVSEDELEAYIKRLRKDDITMRKILEEYLDLPRELGSQGISASTFTYDKQGPPTTHPSAGLSYTRTGAHVFNHPILGPQEENTPIESRVIRPQTSKQVKYDRALLGLGGVVAEDDKLAFTLADEEQGLGNYDPDIPGGTKLWVRPITASVDSRGRITIATRRATPNAVNVAKGFYSQGAEPPAAALAAARDRETPVLTRPRQASARGSPGYGVESMASVNSSGRAAPFSGPDDKPPDFRRLLAGNSQRNI